MQQSFRRSSSNGSSARFGGNRGGGGYGNNSGRSRYSVRPQQRSRAKFIDPSLFVQKASLVEAEAYIPEFSFDQFGVHPQLLQNIELRGYTTPTPIQDQAIPYLLEGKDLIGIANTGTGKTAAFLVPLINKVFTNRNLKVLIVVPTRELAVQIEQEFRQFAKGMGIYSTLCIGGVGIRSQIYGLQRNSHFVIGTPGRLRDLEQQNALSFGAFSSIVLDEVDRMFDMGFIQDVRYITSKLPQERQSLFFSATMPPALNQLMQGFLQNPVTVSVKSRESSANVDQDIIRVTGQSKVDVLHGLLQKAEFEKVLVFSRTKRGTEKLAQMLYSKGIEVGAIHGNKSQSQRQRAIQLFKQNRISVLVATDVASRGLDIDDVTHVINFDIPETYEDYIHRIGRTGRANKKGIALTFVE
jgi:superfamily II DNA/RNA helicase